MEIKVVRTPQEIKKEWESLVLESGTATFFQTYEWAQVWWRNFREGEPYILTVTETEAIAIAPFLKTNGKLVFWGTEPILGEELVTDYGDIVIQEGREDEVWREILGHLRIKNLPLKLHFLREQSPTFVILKRETKENIFHEEVCPYLDLPKSWEEYLLSLERKKRQELQRKIRKIEGAGSFKVIPFSGNGEDLDQFFSLVRCSSDQKEGFLTPKMEVFFRDFIKLFQAKKMIDLNFLEFEGQKIAAALSFIFKDEVLLYNSGFDPNYSYLAPGLVLKALLVKKAIEAGRRKFDFLRGQERYKYDLGAEEEHLYCVDIAVK